MGWDGYGEGRRIWICFFFVKIYDRVKCSLYELVVDYEL